ncbi:MAG: hypothetical protein AAF385_03205 [Pseudomonadota bacterium]
MSLTPIFRAGLCALFLFGSGTHVAAAPGTEHARPMIELAQSSGMTLDQAIRRVQSQYGGRIVNAYTEVRNGREVHKVRILDAKGKVRTVSVPGRRLERR